MQTLEILKSLADLNRLRILNLLKEVQKACNCDLEEVLNLNQSNTSRHITKLKKDSIINTEKVGKWSYYTLNLVTLERYPFINDILDSLSDNIFIEDRMKLKLFINTKNSCSNFEK
ncbi:MAG: ArsR/SmtB family transcription factor [Fusobacteriaceae bacterium]